MITDFNCQKEQNWTFLQGQQMKEHQFQGSNTTSLYPCGSCPQTVCVCAECRLSIDSLNHALHEYTFEIPVLML